MTTITTRMFIVPVHVTTTATDEELLAAARATYEGHGYEDEQAPCNTVGEAVGDLLHEAIGPLTLISVSDNPAAREVVKPPPDPHRDLYRHLTRHHGGLDEAPERYTLMKLRDQHVRFGHKGSLDNRNGATLDGGDEYGHTHTSHSDLPS